MRVIGLTFPTQEPEEPRACPHCGKTYQSAGALEKHIHEKHSDEEPDEAQE